MFIEINLKAIIILDQFNYKYITYNDLEQIEEELIGKQNLKFKMIICSDIKGHFIRSSIIQLWGKIIKEPKQISFKKNLDMQKLFIKIKKKYIKLFLNILIMYQNL